jgi:hypothetical protein
MWNLPELYKALKSNYTTYDEKRMIRAIHMRLDKHGRGRDTYSTREFDGRLYASGSSMQNASRKVRRLLAVSHVYEFDFRVSYPSLISSIADLDGLSMPAFAHYSRTPESVRQDLSDETGYPIKVIKKAIQSITCGGVSTIKHSFFTELSKEVDLFYAYMMSAFPSYMGVLGATCTPSNIKGRRIFFFLELFEQTCLMALVDCIRPYFEIMSYHHDGVCARLRRPEEGSNSIRKIDVLHCYVLHRYFG